MMNRDIKETTKRIMDEWYALQVQYMKDVTDVAEGVDEWVKENPDTIKKLEEEEMDAAKDIQDNAAFIIAALAKQLADRRMDLLKLRLYDLRDTHDA